MWVLGGGGRVCVCVYLCAEGRRGTALKLNVPITNIDLHAIHTNGV